MDSGSQSVAVDLSTTTRDNILIEEGMDRSNYFEANNYMSHCSAAGSCFSEVNVFDLMDTVRTKWWNNTQAHMGQIETK